ncbi:MULTISPECIES: LysM peptidoglycan-binding domain-containing protein [Aerococcus]|uniref:LysM peptidoglycan-binding domain-containing protein n=1 Tax=Aerococcus TaxID=1375 RepID=UPI0015EC922E|nr:MULTISPECIES: LysM peptidoglycan-binding domain-containing protein [Aerococcus]MDK6688779.1 LysM peptidoglycan-binding domain-containing protein [Aerococcus urinae]MDK8132944.1 LysM peptidoglycan-binding domain-containing protein [Aerococcus urinae]MDK8484618.1 LysM peptidoglycan-binding domain-containing protein [Aerococcus urinae]MDL5179465.1 LysM peptidoglycan-binding domain-containing protein [Aerococcus tenax]MDL5208364.1 LysM peptidoglycan-binding domain-containing protein [Aerococcus
MKARNQKMNQYNKWISLASLSLLSAAALQVAGGPEVKAEANPGSASSGWVQEGHSFKTVDEAMTYGSQHADWSKYKQYRVNYVSPNHFVLKWELKTPQVSGQNTETTSPVKTSSEKPVETSKAVEKPAGSGSYTVQSGDSLWRISRKHGVSIQDLMTWNKLGANYMLHPGDKLVVQAPDKAEVPTTKPSTEKPSEAAKPAESTTPSASYTVQSGDSLWRISNKYGVSIQDLMTWNKLGANYMLHPGDKLVVKAPDKTEGPSEKPSTEKPATTVEDGWQKEDQSFKTVEEAMAFGRQHADWSKYKQYRVDYAGNGRYVLKWELRNPDASPEANEQKPAKPAENTTSRASYTVQSGDSLWRISNKYGVSIQDLMTWNKLGANYMLHPGDKLVVQAPGKAETPTEKPSTENPAETSKPAENTTSSASYTVQSGDSLWRISNKYGVSIQDLMTWNKLGANYMLHPGDKLVVKAPAKAGTPAEKPSKDESTKPALSSAAKDGWIQESQSFKTVDEAMTYGSQHADWSKYKQYRVDSDGSGRYVLKWKLRTPQTSPKKQSQAVKVNTKHGFVRESRRFSSIQEALNYGNGVFNWRKYKKFYVNYAGPNSYTLDWELR